MIPETRELIKSIEEKYPNLQTKEVLRLACELSIVAFAEICCKSALFLKTPDVHKELYAMLMDDNVTRFAAALPRGMAKSTIISYIFPMWKALTARKPYFVAIISESSMQSKNFLHRIKESLSDPGSPIREIFGNCGEDTAKRWREADIILENDARIIALGTRQKIRGATQKDTRIDVIVLDDFESELNANTVEARVANRKWITEAVIPALSQTGNGRLLCIGTIISEDCFLQYAKNAAEIEGSNWKVMWKAVLDENGKSIWEETYSTKRIKEIKAEYEAFGNLGGFYQEYMNEPQSPEDAPFKDHYFKSYSNEVVNENGQWFVKKQDILVPLRLYMGVDLASSLSIRADFTVLATMGIDPEGNFYVIDIDRTKSNPALHPQMIYDKFMKYKHSGVFIESIAYQESCRQHVKQLMLRNNVFIPGIERKVTSRTSKSERLLSLVPYFAKGKVYIRPGDIHVISEFKAFPRGGHDDIMDAMWLAMTFAKPPRGVNTVDVRRRRHEGFIDGWTI